MANVVFDDESAKRIAAAVKYVEGLQNPEETPAEESSEQSGRTVIRGTFSGSWAKGTDKDVAFTADNGASKTKTATNYFAAVGKDGETTDCVIMRAGSDWVLVSASLETECLPVVTSVSPSSDLTLVTDVSVSGKVVTGLSASIVTKVECVGGNLTVTTEPLSNIATVANLADLVAVTDSTVSLGTLAEVISDNITVLPQTGCT